MHNAEQTKSVRSSDNLSQMAIRIIGGTHRGRRIKTPTGKQTRPTSERVREALFSRLQSQMHIDGARVLDLFAGTGALSFEALSRGAATATLVDSSPACTKIIRENAEHLGYADQITVYGTCVLTALGYLETEKFDLLLIDPPYELESSAVLLSYLERVRKDGWIVLEHASRKPAPTFSHTSLELTSSHSYGDSSLSMYRINE